MSERRSPTQDLADRVEAVAARAVLGLRDTGLLAGVRAAIVSSGFEVVDVAGSANQLLSAVADRQPRLAVAALDVLGVDPSQTIRGALVRSPDTAMVVLSPLDTVPVWLLEAGADAVVAQAEIGRLKRVLRDLHDR